MGEFLYKGRSASGEPMRGRLTGASSDAVANRLLNIGVIPVRFNRTGIAEPETFPLMNGSIHQLALAANSTHDRLFIDIPPGSSELLVEAGGADGTKTTS